MIRFNTRMLMAGVASTLLLGACSPAGEGQAAEAVTAPTSASAQAATFEPRPDIREGVEALPRLVGVTTATAAINADLDRIDADTEGCEAGSYSRTVTQPMTGPAFVTYAITDEYACEGTAYPSVGTTAITYDLSTGRRVDWVAAAPGLSATRPDSEGQSLPATYEPGLQSVALAEWYGQKMMAATDSEWLDQCRDLFTTEMLSDRYFKVWLDARTGGIAVAPDFPHVAQACAETATMTEAEMRRFDVAPAVIEAVLAATAARNVSPQEG